MMALKGAEGREGLVCRRRFGTVAVLVCVYVYTCGLVRGVGCLIVMHVDGFRDTSFQKQGPH